MMHVREEVAQATVEMAVVTPVLIVLALVVYNVMTFVSATARFDRVAPDIVIAHAISPEGDGTGSLVDASERIKDHLEEAMGNYDVEIEVAGEDGDGTRGDGSISLDAGLRTYTCSMKFKPWPTGLTIAGVPLGAPAFLAHERTVTVDPWRPGVVA